MKVLSIDNNSGKYFLDVSDNVLFSDTVYQGRYNYTPVYPRYTIESSRMNYLNNKQIEIDFFTMLPIKRLWNNYLVEFRFKFNFGHLEDYDLSHIIELFEQQCDDNIKNLNVNSLTLD